MRLRIALLPWANLLSSGMAARCSLVVVKAGLAVGAAFLLLGLGGCGQVMDRLSGSPNQQTSKPTEKAAVAPPTPPSLAAPTEHRKDIDPGLASPNPPAAAQALTPRSPSTSASASANTPATEPVNRSQASAATPATEATSAATPSSRIYRSSDARRP